MKAETLLEAAKLIDSGECCYGCCAAIECALGVPTCYASPEHEFFEKLFPFNNQLKEYNEHWHGEMYIERQARVLALLICYWELKLLEA